jgi:hypothetical protein
VLGPGLLVGVGGFFWRCWFGRRASSVGGLLLGCWPIYAGQAGGLRGLFGLIEVGISSGGTRGLRDRALWATGSDRRARGATGPVPCIPEGG